MKDFRIFFLCFLAPKFSVNYLSMYGNKKDVGVCSSAPIPELRPSHCLFARISNASQPTPSDYIYQYIIHPRERFVALPLCEKSKLRSLSSQTGNVQKTSFPFSLPYKRYRRPQDSIDVISTRPCPFCPSHCMTKAAWTGLVSCKFTKFFLIIYIRWNFLRNFKPFTPVFSS